jgi:formylmethanofuran dehydrogenase subunit B
MIQSEETVHASVPCPFCGLACDDLEVRVAAGKAKVVAHGCPRSVALFEHEALEQASIEANRPALRKPLHAPPRSCVAPGSH